MVVFVDILGLELVGSFVYIIPAVAAFVDTCTTILRIHYVQILIQCPVQMKGPNQLLHLI